MPDTNSRYAEDINNAKNRQPQRTKQQPRNPQKTFKGK